MTISTEGYITDVPGIRVGHAHDLDARTGCTVVLPDQAAVAGADVRGSAPGTRELELLRPLRLIQKVHALLLTGGSAFGLDAAGGVQHYLEERNIGYDTAVAKVPIVPAAVIFDLAVGDSQIRPDKEMGYAACKNATVDENRQGRIGVGAGASVGKILGQHHAMDGGVGSCAAKLEDVTIGVFVVVNALGNIIDPASGKTIAGARHPKTGRFIDPIKQLSALHRTSFSQISNTTLAVLATDAKLDRLQAIKVAQMAQNGIAKAITPAHTTFDGDITFALSVGSKNADINALGALGAELVVQAILNSVRNQSI